MNNRKCRFCQKELDEDHFFFCGELCEELFTEEYELKTEAEREKFCGSMYRPI